MIMKNEGATYIETTSDEIMKLHDISYDLVRLATAFHKTGNDYIASELSRISEEIAESASIISTAIGQDLTNQIQASDKRFANTLTAVLDMAEKAK